jgi:hypothetical protein
VVNIASISAERFQRPPEDLYSDQEAPGSVVIGLLRGSGPLEEEDIFNHLAKNSIEDV